MPTTTATFSQERTGGVTFKGTPLTLIGPEIKVGQRAPEFEVLAQDLSTVTLAASQGKVRLISVVPSLDTPVCDQQTRRFNQEAAALSKTAVLTISMDLPFAQKRWCGAAGIDPAIAPRPSAVGGMKVQVLSDHRDGAFGRGYGVLIKELRLLARSVFVVDGAGILRYVEIVPEVSSHPNYDVALAAARGLAA